jgi:hypothetical protein
MDIDIFLKQVTAECKASNVEFVVSPFSRVHYNHITCNGFFESLYPAELTTKHIIGEKSSIDVVRSGNTKAVLAVARGGKTDAEFLSLVAHEYCHMRQYIEQSALWIGADQFMLFDRWLEGEEVGQEELDAVWKKIVLLEADCERRVVDIIVKENLPLNIQEYCRRANSYIFFYHWVKKHRKWYNKAPYEIKGILDIMPYSMLANIHRYADENISEVIMSAFDQCV